MDYKDHEIRKLRQAGIELFRENMRLNHIVNMLEERIKQLSVLAEQREYIFEQNRFLNEMSQVTGIIPKKKRQAAETIFKNTVN